MRRNLFFAMAAIEAPILELRSVEMSLEDVFLQLTTDEAVEAGDESTAGEEEVVAGA